MDQRMQFKFLLADDDRDDQEILMEAILQDHPDTQIHTVFNGQKVLDYLAERTPAEWPSLIILDYKMPVMNATEVLERMQHINIPKVVWSTSNQPEHMQTCRQLGTVKYFIKPNNRAELKAMVQELFRICGER
ncbi:CheY chemotaxis protein or a CheY-like REC (receiver) domain [Chitinophaga sancti]|uniref:CheY chemotaxis protein or a CheY-like REC (Receiver) domain n=2 Tax=Chitinophaga sancti TaxID=1004 RepID=A0A1K1SSZ1_9BACT|nr:CheY chemotaxis protein or a CheY-like REC (receiver) domain [Chitinophaga sancti]